MNKVFYTFLILLLLSPTLKAESFHQYFSLPSEFAKKLSVPELIYLSQVNLKKNELSARIKVKDKKKKLKFKLKSCTKDLPGSRCHFTEDNNGVQLYYLQLHINKNSKVYLKIEYHTEHDWITAPELIAQDSGSIYFYDWD